MTLTVPILLCVFAFQFALGGSVSFQAGSSTASLIPYLLSTAQTTIEKNSSTAFSAAFLTGINATTYASIYTNWPDAIFFEADMDIDCDGTDWQCPGNTDGQPNTSYGNLSAYHVPYIVVPDTFVSKKHLRNNSISAVICAGQMFYGILGDTNGDTPEVIGEASWLMGQTCFPNDHLGGGNGHASSDVLYIVFNEQFQGVNETSITDWNGLRTLGDEKINTLVKALNDSGSLSSPTGGTTQKSVASFTSTPIWLAFTLLISIIIWTM